MLRGGRVVNEQSTESLDARRVALDEQTAGLERHLAAAQQITNIGSWEWDVASNRVTWTDELYRIYGLEPQSCEITFELFLSKVLPEDREPIQQAVTRALERGERFTYRERIVRPDGSVRHLDTLGDVKRDASGNVRGLIGTCRDVTEERKRDETIRLFSDIVNNVQIGLSVWCLATEHDAGAAVLVAFNPAAERTTGVSLRERVGEPISAILPGAMGSELIGALSRVARDRTVLDIPSFRFAGSDRRTFSVKAFPLPGDCVGLSFEDITLEARSRQLQESEQRVLEMIASGAPLSWVLTQLVLMIEEQAPPTIGSILLLDEGGTRIRTGAAPHLPDEYNQAIDSTTIGPAVGSCGTAAFLAKPVFVTDIETDPLWDDHRALARRFELRACWSTPIMASGGRVLGTFALYYREPRSPGKSELDLIARATHIAGIAIQRKHVADQLRALTAHTEAVREDERTSVSREIHDVLGQALTALKMDIAWLGRHVESGGVWLPKLEEMSKMTDELIDSVRRISADLRPGVLDDLGLAAAIEWQAQEFQRRTGTTCVVHSNLGDHRFERDLGTAVFRIFQEALTNIVRHANATHVDVRLEREGARLRLTVRDDGSGISAEALSSPGSLGLLGITERARRLGGTVDIRGQPGAGSVVVLDVPLRERLPR
jgi:PAS domain S-box-containing protein